MKQLTRMTEPLRFYILFHVKYSGFKNGFGHRCYDVHPGPDTKKNQIPLPLVRKQTIPTEQRHLSTKFLVPTFVD
jgi:hypothetical protein